MSSKSSSAPDYGVDAPYVIRNLLIGGIAGLLLWIAIATRVWSGRVGPLRFAPVGFGVAGIALMCMATLMWWASKYGKLRERDKLLDRIAWRGDEQVLDVGCGRGLMLIGAAKRIPRGKAIGIDLWKTEDLSGNDPAATTENAAREGVAERVDVKTADMRKLPFADASIDVVVSRAAIHNLYDSADRKSAILEIARVLKRPGVALIDDIRHGEEYGAAFDQGGCDVRRISSRAGSLLWTLITFGSLRPVTLLATKR